MLGTLHLLRHGEVDNPRGVVYADLPGFGLSTTGTSQAEAAGVHLAQTDVSAIVSSPLRRAVETARAVSERTETRYRTDERLREWGLATRWAGVAWADLPELFPGEAEAYANDPTNLGFSPETVEEVAARMQQVVIDLGATHPGGAVVLVSHQDPLQALRLALLERPLSGLQQDKPVHAGIDTLEPGPAGWVEMERWSPPEGSAPFPPLDGRPAP